MRRIGLTLTATMLFLTVPAMARAGGDKNAAPTGKGNSSAAKTTPNTSKKTASAQPAKAENGVAPSELQRLQDLIQAQHEQLAAQQKALEQQQREIDSLKGQAVSPAAVAPAAIDTAAPAATAIPAAAAPASAATPRATE